MAEEIGQKKAVKQWYEGALRDRDSARGMLEHKHYQLKGVIEKQDMTPVPIHDLRRLAELAKLDVSREQRIWLREITTFNIEARIMTRSLNFISVLPWSIHGSGTRNAKNYIYG